MATKVNKTILSLLAVVGLVNNVSAQKPDAGKVTEVIGKYGKTHNVAIFSNKEHLIIDVNKKGEISAVNKVVSEQLMLTENTADYNEQEIHFTSFTQIKDINAYSLQLENGSFKKIPARGFSTQNATSGAIFYDDHKKINVAFAAPTKGTITHLDYTEVYKEARFLSSFFFGFYVPVVDQEFKVTVSNKVKIKYLLRGDNTDKIAFTKTESGGKTTYCWKAGTVRYLTREGNTMGYKYYSPHIIIYIDEIEVQGKSQPFLHDVGSLYNWYYSMIEKADTDTTGDGQLKQLTDSLTEGVTEPIEKAKRIYYWVQKNLKYVAFEDGLGGFVPRMPNDIYEKRYGDCKDMSCLLHKLLDLAGLDARICWIGTRDIPYTYSEVPTPASDNHMIATIIVDGKRYFIDGTCAYCAFDMPSSFTQGKEALISLGKDKFLVEKVPVMPKEFTVISDSVYLSIAGKELIGEGKVTYKGYAKVDVMYSYYSMSSRLTNEEKLKAFIQRGNNKITVDYARANNFDNSDSVFTIWYKFRLPDYVTFVGNEIYLNMNLEKVFDQYKHDLSTLDVDIDNEFAYTIKNVVILKAPDSTSVEYIPANASYDSPFFRFKITYQNEGKYIRLYRSYAVDDIVLSRTNFSLWMQCNSKVKQAYKDQLILKLTEK